jgi:predicted Fe-Mo cluster-binding NifX family protein
VQTYDEAAIQQQNSGDPMKYENARIAIASDSGRDVSSHFGRAPLYVVLTMKNGHVVAREERPKFTPHVTGGQHMHQHDQGQHSLHHSAMVDPILDCQVVVARGMGDGAYIHLTEAGLDVLLSELHTVEEVASAIESGSIQHQPTRLHAHGHPRRS